MYYFWQYQLGIIFFNSNLVLEMQEKEEFKKWINIRDSFPDEGEPHKVVSYKRIGEFCKAFFMKSGEHMYLELEGAWRYGTKFRVLNGSLEDAIAYANEIIYSCVRGANLHHLDVLVDLFADYIPGGVKPSWFDDAVNYFLSEEDKARHDLLMFDSDGEKARLINRFGKDLVEFTSSLYFQPFGDNILGFIEDEGTDLIDLRYMVEDERDGNDCDCWNPWPAIRYLKFPTGLKFIDPWESGNGQHIRVTEVKNLFHSLTDEEHRWLINLNKKFREWTQERGLEDINWYKL